MTLHRKSVLVTAPVVQRSDGLHFRPDSDDLNDHYPLWNERSPGLLENAQGRPVPTCSAQAERLRRSRTAEVASRAADDRIGRRMLYRLCLMSLSGPADAPDGGTVVGVGV